MFRLFDDLLYIYDDHFVLCRVQHFISLVAEPNQPAPELL